MNLRDTLRKAAELVVELPPEQASQESAREAAPEPAAVAGASDDIDRRLREMNQKLASLETGEPATAPTQTKTVDQIVRDTHGPNLDEIQVPASAPPPEVSADGKVDFSAIYQHAGLPASSFTCEQMLDMLGSLPAELPLETKRQTVRVSLNSMGKALGATPETIVADASRKLAALSAYVENLTKETGETVAAAQMEIASLEAQIQEKRKSIESAQRKLSEATDKCKSESDRLDDVLEFFSLDQPPSKYAGQEPKRG